VGYQYVGQDSLTLQVSQANAQLTVTILLALFLRAVWRSRQNFRPKTANPLESVPAAPSHRPGYHSYHYRIVKERLQLRSFKTEHELLRLVAKVTRSRGTLVPLLAVRH